MVLVFLEQILFWCSVLSYFTCRKPSPTPLRMISSLCLAMWSALVVKVTSWISCARRCAAPTLICPARWTRRNFTGFSSRRLCITGWTTYATLTVPWTKMAAKFSLMVRTENQNDFFPKKETILWWIFLFFDFFPAGASWWSRVLVTFSCPFVMGNIQMGGSADQPWVTWQSIEASVNQTACAYWLIDWLIDWFFIWCWLIDWLIFHLVFVDWLIDWLIDWFFMWCLLIDWLIDWLIDFSSGVCWLVWMDSCHVLTLFFALDFFFTKFETWGTWECVFVWPTEVMKNVAFILRKKWSGTRDLIIFSIKDRASWSGSVSPWSFELVIEWTENVCLIRMVEKEDQEEIGKTSSCRTVSMCM